MTLKKYSAKQHRERSQPLARLHKHGLLEKHKDYKLRSVDHSIKRAKLKTLKEKARARNTDGEFRHAMISTQTKDGVHVNKDRERENDLSAETVKLMKSQDLGYVKMYDGINKKRINALKVELGFVGLNQGMDGSLDANESKHVRFVERAADIPATPVDKPVVALSRPFASKLKTKEERKKLRELSSRLQRASTLDKTLVDLQTQKNLQAKGRKYQVKETENGKVVYKWRQERLK